MEQVTKFTGALGIIAGIIIGLGGNVFAGLIILVSGIGILALGRDVGTEIPKNCFHIAKITFPLVMMSILASSVF